MPNIGASAAPQSTETNRSLRWSGTRRTRVLLAEDDWAFREMLVRAFERDGYEVAAVGNGTDLLHVLGTSMLPRSAIKEFDLIVSDLRMPGWSGLAGIEGLGSNPLLPPIVLITAFGSDEVRQRAKEAGVVAVLDKPFDLDELVALAATLIAHPQARR